MQKRQSRNAAARDTFTFLSLVWRTQRSPSHALQEDEEVKKFLIIASTAGLLATTATAFAQNSTHEQRMKAESQQHMKSERQMDRMEHSGKMGTTGSRTGTTGMNEGNASNSGTTGMNEGNASSSGTTGMQNDGASADSKKGAPDKASEQGNN